MHRRSELGRSARVEMLGGLGQSVRRMGTAVFKIGDCLGMRLRDQLHVLRVSDGEGAESHEKGRAPVRAFSYLLFLAGSWFE